MELPHPKKAPTSRSLKAAEPRGFSGVHSLTSHREAFVEQVKDALKKHLGDRWDALAEDQQQQLLAKNLRKFAPKANINPDNIAFGLSR